MLAFGSLLALCCLATAYAQLAALVGNGNRSDPGCALWTPWSECTWLKADPSKRVSPWNQPFFSQIGKACQQHPFYENMRRKYQNSAEGIWRYFRSITEDTQPCGMCSFQQSCGFHCSRLAPKFNVSEQHCAKYNQAHSCTLVPNSLSDETTCTVWPNAKANLTDIGREGQNILSGTSFFDLKFTNCIRGRGQNGESRCRCCCHPYKPDPVTFECKK